jgi:hypothetical protein
MAETSTANGLDSESFLGLSSQNTNALVDFGRFASQPFLHTPKRNRQETMAQMDVAERQSNQQARKPRSVAISSVSMFFDYSPISTQFRSLLLLAFRSLHVQSAP